MQKFRNEARTIHGRFAAKMPEDAHGYCVIKSCASKIGPSQGVGGV
jgi:hypothetical protein